MKTKMLPRAVRKFLRESKGATTIEYAIVVGVVVVGAAAAVEAFTGQITGALTEIGNDIGTTTEDIAEPNTP